VNGRLPPDEPVAAVVLTPPPDDPDPDVPDPPDDFVTGGRVPPEPPEPPEPPWPPPPDVCGLVVVVVHPT